MVRRLVGLSFHDTQCGFKAFRRDTVLPVVQRLQVDRFAFDVELIALTCAAGLRIHEVPVVWVNAPGATVGVRQGAQAFVDLLQIRCRAQRLGLAGVPFGGQVEAQPPAR